MKRNKKQLRADQHVNNSSSDATARHGTGDPPGSQSHKPPLLMVTNVQGAECPGPMGLCTLSCCQSSALAHLCGWECGTRRLPAQTSALMSKFSQRSSSLSFKVITLLTSTDSFKKIIILKVCALYTSLENY